MFQTIDPQNLDIRKVTISDFKVWVFENLEKQERGQGPLVSHSCHLNGLRQSPVHVHDTMSGDVAVTAHRRWPPPHVVPTLSLHCVEQRTVSPTSPSFSRMPATTVLCRSLPPRPHWRQSPSSATWTRHCLPKLRLHPTVLVALTTGPLNHFPMLPSPVPLHRHSSTSSPTTDRSSHLPAPSLPPRAPLRPRVHQHHFNSGFPPLLRPRTGTPLRRPSSPS
jgi:hypothetical protein